MDIQVRGVVIQERGGRLSNGVDIGVMGWTLE